MAIVDVGPEAYSLTAQVGWLGLKVGSHLVLPCIRQMNPVNSRMELCCQQRIITSDVLFV